MDRASAMKCCFDDDLVSPRSDVRPRQERQLRRQADAGKWVLFGSMALLIGLATWELAGCDSIALATADAVACSGPFDSPSVRCAALEDGAFQGGITVAHGEARSVDSAGLGAQSFADTVLESGTGRPVREIRIEGRVLDPLGRPLPHARVALGREAARSSEQDLGARQIAVSDEWGGFSATYSHSLANTSRVFASCHQYPPVYTDIDLEQLEANGRVFAVLQFPAGADLALRVIDILGAPVAGCSIELSTRGDPRTLGMVEGGALPSDRAEKTLLGETSQDGVFESQGWPVLAEVRLRVLSGSGESRSIAAVRPGRVEPDGTAVVAANGGRSSVTLTIQRFPDVRVTCRGTAEELPADQKLRAVLENERGLRCGGVIDWGGDSDFGLTFHIRQQDVAPEATYLVVHHPDGRAARFGPYRIDGPTDLGWIDVRW